MARNRLASQRPATRKTRFGSLLVLSRVHRERARRQVERVSSLLSNPLSGVASVISILWRKAISSGSPYSRRRRLEFAHALLQITEGHVGMREDRLDALKKRNEISFRCHRRSKSVGRGREGDSLGPIRFQRNVRRTVGQDLRYDAIATSGVDGGRAHHVPHADLYGFALRD